jgi:hypothetical protein
MTETDFFRIARERMGDYTLTVNRASALGIKPYRVTLEHGSQTLSGEGETLPEVLSSLMARAGVDRRKTARDDAPPELRPEDTQWPCG